MNAGRSPSWIFRNHLKNQGSNFLAYRLATSPRLGSGKPFPIQPKTGTMPADNGSGRHLDERFLPSSPAPSQYDPEQRNSRSWLATAVKVDYRWVSASTIDKNQQ